ncbi:ABC transporter ATP-binding protein [Bacillus massiliigorillae]|uniref:ABC transporter ATP-binding protein n=1 Tax=Bacillus massiliigorillae TaxID=1243664 RepID=UPI0003A77C39|nr:ABC transporter ATP-binding protein [Bacillus massiliigorillae]
MTNHSSNHLLEIKNLEAGFMIDGAYYNAVNRVSLLVKSNTIIGVVGESGCGKSVLSLSIMKLLPKDRSKIKNGDIFFEGKNIGEFSEAEMNTLRGKEISMIFQEPMTSLNPVFTIGYQLKEVFMNHEKSSKRNIETRCIQLLKKVGIGRAEEVMKEYPYQLSGGMRQRVMIAIAIACQPKLLIADEPTTALDVTVQAQILQLLKDLQAKSKMSILFITHDLGVVAEMCDEVVVMYGGQIVERATVDQLFYNPKHPYTILLLDAMPSLTKEVEVLSSIKGIVPSLQNMPQQGCRFVSRCPNALEKCKTSTPSLRNVEQGHEVACLLYESNVR